MFPLEDWLALVIGNTRLHWGLFQSGQLASVWHTPHLAPEIAARLQQAEFAAAAWQRISGWTCEMPLQKESRPDSLWIASVVPAQTKIWARQRSGDGETQLPTFVVSRSHVPLQNIYPTLGIDRAINLLGAGHKAGWPVLVIDAGTAITFIAGQDGAVKGGAILPGLRLQAQSLGQKTANLPAEDLQLDGELLERWAMDTSGAIASGLVYGAIATLQDYLSDWWQRFPDGKAVLTGGDGPLLHSLLQIKTPEVASRVQVDSYLMFYGMQRYRRAVVTKP